MVLLCMVSDSSAGCLQCSWCSSFGYSKQDENANIFDPFHSFVYVIHFIS